ncbi:hypothetical protein [Chryseobacterium gossypii]|uniref:hypothetical protein n=1 Tax=Chryseobacterium gossypii TaxID=3231602 RepID=UPI0035239843
MKVKFITVMTVVFLSNTLSAQIFPDKVGINTNPDASASLHVTSDPDKIKGTLLSPMTEEQRNSIEKPASGLIVFDETKNCLMINTGTKENPDWKCSFEQPTSLNSMAAKANENYPQPNTKERMHFYGKFKVSNMETNQSYVNLTGQNPASNIPNNVVAYTTMNKPDNLSKIPSMDGLRMNVIFNTGGDSSGKGGAVYQPIIENVSGKDLTDIAVYDNSTVSGTLRVPISTLKKNEFVNVDPDKIVYYDKASFEEVRSLVNHNGNLYRCTWWAFYDEANQEYNIHMVMEVFK